MLYVDARERLDYLLDHDSFAEIGTQATHRATAFGMGEKRVPGDGLIAGWGTIDGREVCVFAQDEKVFGGALGEVHGDKMCAVMEMAVHMGRPLIGLYAGAGARIQEGADSLDAIARTLRWNTQASGVVPQISAIMGPCAGGNAYSPALSDFIVMVDGQGKMFVTGPGVLRDVTGEDTTQEELGGAHLHLATAGSCHYVAPSEQEALDWIRDLLDYLPNNCHALPQLHSAEPARGDLAVPTSPEVPYDIHEVIAALVDAQDFLEIQAGRADNIVCGFGRVNGQPVGIVANQPLVLAGAIDAAAAEKAARFTRTCDAFSIPLLYLVDVPGFLPGTDEEHGGLVRRGAKLLYAYAEASVPKITVVLRKAYGGAYCVMGSQGLGADVNLAWPTAEIAVLGVDSAVRFIFRRELEDASPAEVKRLRDEYAEILSPQAAAENGLIDAVIEPHSTRRTIERYLRLLRDKKVARPVRKHGNIPL